MTIERSERITYEEIAISLYGQGMRPQDAAKYGLILAQLNPDIPKPTWADVSNMFLPAVEDIGKYTRQPCSVIVRAIIDGDEDMVEGNGKSILDNALGMVE